IRPDNQRRTTILRYASWATVLPISLVVRLPFDSGPFDQSWDRRDGPRAEIVRSGSRQICLTRLVALRKKTLLSFPPLTGGDDDVDTERRARRRDCDLNHGHDAGFSRANVTRFGGSYALSNRQTTGCSDRLQPCSGHPPLRQHTRRGVSHRRPRWLRIWA